MVRHLRHKYIKIFITMCTIEQGAHYPWAAPDIACQRSGNWCLLCSRNTSHVLVTNSLHLIPSILIWNSKEVHVEKDKCKFVKVGINMKSAANVWISRLSCSLPNDVTLRSGLAPNESLGLIYTSGGGPHSGRGRVSFLIRWNIIII